MTTTVTNLTTFTRTHVSTAPVSTERRLQPQHLRRRQRVGILEPSTERDGGEESAATEGAGGRAALKGMVVSRSCWVCLRRGWLSGGDGAVGRRDGGAGGDGWPPLSLRVGRIESFGGPKEVGETVLKKIAGTRPDITATLIDTSLRQDPSRNINYYKLEFGVQGPSFYRHNVAVCAVESGKLFTLNAQSPESLWPKVKEDIHKIADSFILSDVQAL